MNPIPWAVRVVLVFVGVMLLVIGVPGIWQRDADENLIGVCIAGAAFIAFGVA